MLWVYSPDANRDFKTDFYPGTSYVDTVGLDAYFQDAYSINGYDQLIALNKPFAFTVVGPQIVNGNFDYSFVDQCNKTKIP